MDASHGFQGHYGNCVHYTFENKVMQSALKTVLYSVACGHMRRGTSVVSRTRRTVDCGQSNEYMNIYTFLGSISFSDLDFSDSNFFKFLSVRLKINVCLSLLWMTHDKQAVQSSEQSLRIII